MPRRRLCPGAVRQGTPRLQAQARGQFKDTFYIAGGVPVLPSLDGKLTNPRHTGSGSGTRAQASAQGATKSYSTPTAPKTPVVPDANQLAQELEAYDSCVHTCPLSLPDGSWILSLARNGVWFPRGFGWGMAASARTSGPLLTQRPSASKELDGVSGVWTGNVAGDGISGQRSEEQEPEDYQFWTRNATDSPNLFVSPSHPSFRSFLGLRPNPRPIPQLPVFFGVGSPPFPILKPPHDEPPTSRAVPVDTSSSSSAAVAAESVEEADALGADDYLKLCEQPVQAAKH
jgi:hypothetical protein